jgi:uncharacterized phage protein gp47/JayE
MAITKLTVPSIDELRDRYTADVRRLKIRAGITSPNVAAGSESYIRGQAVAAAVQLVMARECSVQDAQMGDAATGDDIKRLCENEGITIDLGSGASGFVVVSCAGGTTYAKDDECKTADGLRYKVATTTVANDGDPVPIVGVDVGTRTIKAAGTVVQWTSPPVGSGLEAIVDTSGLTNGTNADTDTTLQNKWIERKRHPPRGGNWAHIAADAEAGSASIEKAFVYPGVYGPSTVHVAITIAAVQEDAYTREANPVIRLAASQSVVAGHPEHADFTFTTVNDWDVDLIIKLDLPEPKSVGGTGGGWVDAAADRWPTTLNAASPYAPRLSAAPSNGRVLSVTSDIEPVDDAHIAVWSVTAKKFLHAQIASHSGAGPYTINLYEPLDPADLSANDWVVPLCEHIDDYAETLAQRIGTLGPGQKTTDVTKLPRSYRRPKVQESWPCDITSKTTDYLSTAHSEIWHVEFYRGFDATPTTFTALPIACPTDATTGTAPYCIRLGKLGFYQR